MPRIHNHYSTHRQARHPTTLLPTCRFGAAALPRRCTRTRCLHMRRKHGHGYRRFLYQCTRRVPRVCRHHAACRLYCLLCRGGRTGAGKPRACDETNLPIVRWADRSLPVSDEHLLCRLPRRLSRAFSTYSPSLSSPWFVPERRALRAPLLDIRWGCWAVGVPRAWKEGGRRDWRRLTLILLPDLPRTLMEGIYPLWQHRSVGGPSTQRRRCALPRLLYSSFILSLLLLCSFCHPLFHPSSVSHRGRTPDRMAARPTLSLPSCTHSSHHKTSSLISNLRGRRRTKTRRRTRMTEEPSVFLPFCMLHFLFSITTMPLHTAFLFAFCLFPSLRREGGRRRKDLGLEEFS